MYVMSGRIAFAKGLFLRALATVCDMVLCLWAWSLLLFIQVIANPWVLAGFLILGLALIEMRLGRTPGKWFIGLKMELPTDSGLRLFGVLVRNGIKWGLIGAVLWAPQVFNSFRAYPSIEPQGFWPLLLLPLIGVMTTIFWQRLLKTDALPHDILSGIRVLPEEPKLRFWQPLMVCGGLCLLSGVSFWLMLVLLSRCCVGTGGDGKLSSVKANMFTFQTLIETYAVDWKNTYPNTIGALKADANLPGRAYWKEFVNPFTSKSGYNLSYSVYSLSGQYDASHAGLVLYEFVRATGKRQRYYIYGLDKNGRLIRDKGQNFFLTNS